MTPRPDERLRSYSLPPAELRLFRPRWWGLVLLAALGGCSDGYQSPSKLPTVAMTIGSRQYTVEIAADDPAREKGLMYRDSMPADWGMIFVFPDEAERNFWMKNTRIPLDIVFVDSHGKVVSVKTMKPYDLSGTSSVEPAMYAIELNAGQAGVSGVKAGDVLVIPEPARKTDR